MGVQVRQKTKGKGKPWWVFIIHKGKRTSKRIVDKNAAEKVASEIRAKLKLGEFSFEEEKPVPTFGEYAEAWINTTVRATCKESTLRDYKDILKIHVQPFFNETFLTDITRGMVKDFLMNKVNDGYAKSTVSHMKDVISGPLNKAIDDEIISSNPTFRLGKYIQSNNQKKVINPLEQKELKALFDAVSKHYPEHYPLFLLLVRTGMRIGEALCLKWGDIGFNSRFILVKRSISRGKVTTPKNKKYRKVDMSLQLADALKQHMHQCKIKGMAMGLGDKPEFIFTNENGLILDKDNWRRRVFNKAFEKAELRKIRIHDMRHTYATLRISKGDNIADVSKQLGHHSVKLTMDTYYHWIPGKKKDEVDGLDDASFRHLYAPYTHPIRTLPKIYNKKRPTHSS